MLKRIDLILPLFIIFTLLVYFNYFPLNVDSKWILYCANEMVNGSKLYVDLIDVNPPLIFIYSLIPAYFAKFFSVSPIFSFIVFVFSLISISVFLSFQILKKVSNIKIEEIRFYIYGISLCLFILVSYNFGEREHFLMIFILPYILSMIYKDKLKLSNSLLILIALFASFGFNLKPHFFLIFIAIELIFILNHKNIFIFFRIDSLIILFSAFLYLLIIYVFFPEYINFMVPFAIESYTNVFNKNFITLLSNFEFIFFALLMIFIIILAKHKNSISIKIFLVSILSAIIIYLLQQKGWSYHRLPMLVLCSVFLIHLHLFHLQEKRVYSIIFLPIFIAIIFINVINQSYYKNLKKTIDSYGDNKTIYTFSIDIAETQALLSEKQVWGSRFPSLFMYPTLAKGNSEFVSKYTYDAIYNDLLKFKPDIIIFPYSKYRINHYKFFTSNDLRIKEFLTKNYNRTEISNYLILTKN